MELKFSTQALMDMDRIAEMIQQNSPLSALRFLEATEVTANELLTFPQLGAMFETDLPELQGLRVCLVTGFEKYLIIYTIRASVIRVERIVHGSRDLPRILQENQ